MTSRFYAIKKDEMHAFLTDAGFVPMNLPNVVELVYGKVFTVNGHHVSLRIYTAINPTGESREKGSDAIRLVLYSKVEGIPKPVGKQQRCLRVKNWRINLGKAIREVTSPESLPTCNECKSPMVLREGRNGEFWGCVMFHTTGCKGKPVQVQARPQWEVDEEQDRQEH